MKALFWLSLLVIAYVYAGYPLLLAIVARLRLRTRDAGSAAQPGAGAECPGVSIVLAVHNEASRLPARLENLFGLDYPADCRQVIVVSDGSTDATARVLAASPYPIETRLLLRSGKATALNVGVSLARHEIVVFTDARQRFAPGALRALVARFADPDVGCVSGELILDSQSAAGGGERAPSTVSEGIGLYWAYEKWLRRTESLIGSTVGATGAIYAIRRSLWRPLPPDTLLDDVVVPARVILAGKRSVFEASAVAFDPEMPDAAIERRRKTRTLAGNYQLLRLEPSLLLPWRNPAWWQYWSHRIGARLIAPYALVALLVTSAVLVRSGALFTAAFAAQATLYSLAAYGALLEWRARRRARVSIGPPAALRTGGVLPWRTRLGETHRMFAARGRRVEGGR